MTGPGPCRGVEAVKYCPPSTEIWLRRRARFSWGSEIMKSPLSLGRSVIRRSVSPTKQVANEKSAISGVLRRSSRAPRLNALPAAPPRRLPARGDAIRAIRHSSHDRDAGPSSHPLSPDWRIGAHRTRRVGRIPGNADGRRLQNRRRVAMHRHRHERSCANASTGRYNTFSRTTNEVADLSHRLADLIPPRGLLAIASRFAHLSQPRHDRQATALKNRLKPSFKRRETHA